MNRRERRHPTYGNKPGGKLGDQPGGNLGDQPGGNPGGKLDGHQRHAARRVACVAGALCLSLSTLTGMPLTSRTQAPTHNICLAVNDVAPLQAKDPSAFLTLAELNSYSNPDTGASFDYLVQEGQCIHILGYNLEDIRNATGEELDKMVYPSGMKLPTKFLDILDISPFIRTTITGPVADFLLLNYPDEGGFFTYPEYQAALEYLVLYNASLMRESGASITSGSVLESALSHIDSGDWSVSNELTTFEFKKTAESNARIHQILKETYTIIEQNAYNEEDPPYIHEDYPTVIAPRSDYGDYSLTMGCTFYWDEEHLLCPQTPDTNEMLTLDEKFAMDMRPNYWDAMGGGQVKSSIYAFPSTRGIPLLLSKEELTAGLKQAIVNNDTGLSKMDTLLFGQAVADGEFSIDGKRLRPSTGGPEHTKPPESVAPMQSPTQSSAIFDQESTGNKGNNAVSSVTAGGETLAGLKEAGAKPSTNKPFNFRDVIATAAIVFVVISVTTLGIIDYKRKKKDPMNKYKR